MKRSVLLKTITILALSAILSACSLSGDQESDRVSSDGLSRIPNDTAVSFNANVSLARINEVRARYLLKPLRFDPRLMTAANNHAELMGRTGKFGHEFGPKTKFKRRIFSTGFTNSAGENLGVGYRSIDAAIEGWLGSTGHRRILLKPNYSLVGLAYAPNTSGKNPQLNHFWVMIAGAE